MSAAWRPSCASEPNNPSTRSRSSCRRAWLAAARARPASTIVTMRFETIFKDFKTDLPAVTQLLLMFSRIYLHLFGWVLMLAAVVVVPFLWAGMLPPASDPVGHRRMRRRLISLGTLLIGLWVFLVTIALF